MNAPTPITALHSGSIIIGSQPVAPYEANLIAQAAQKRLYIAGGARPLLARLSGRINRLDTCIGVEEHELAVARQRVRDADLRAHTPQFAPGVYWTGIALAITGELAIAKAALDFLDQPEPESWMMALTLGILVFASAKTTARMIRQRPWKLGRWSDVALAVLANLVLGFLFVQVAELRTLLSGNPASGVVNLAIQTTLYVAMVFATMGQIDPEHEAEQLAGRIRRLARTLNAAGTGLWPRRVALAEQHNVTLAKAEVAIRSIEEDASERIYQYRDANSRRRPEGTIPPWFQRPISGAAFEPIALGHPVDRHPNDSKTVAEWAPKQEWRPAPAPDFCSN